MSRRIGWIVVPAIVVAGTVAVAGCGSSNSSTAYGNTPAVARGNAPIGVSFESSGYPAACQKSLETPNSQGAAFTPAQATSFCTCLVQQAQSQGLAAESERSITDDQFKSLFHTCQGQVSGQGSQTTTT